MQTPVRERDEAFVHALMPCRSTSSEYVVFMPPTIRSFGRVVVVAGYAVYAVGAVISFSYEASQGDLRLSSKSDVVLVAGVFASFAALFAWWILTRLVVDDRSGVLARRAFLGLGVQALLMALPYFLYDIGVEFSDWYTFISWFFSIGSLLSGIGFLIMSASYGTQRVVAGGDAGDASHIATFPST